ncbi:sulfatase-like hydrolase/transferase [Stenotrophomonas rhizophila]|uniref:sulfatase-like hydrolase/transferase n=1 Tax=Stenotrophomonas rhizophila TaxID=216778 RepID=UPI0028AF418B|nr:sulfatase-like hydrolase/transferase [Stenotrophomonas rhizophila]
MPVARCRILTRSSQTWMPSFILFIVLLTALPVMLLIEWPDAYDARLFAALGLFTHMGLAACACCLPGWLCSRVAPLSPAATPLTLVIATGWILLVLVNMRVFQLFGFHLNALVLALLVQGGLLQQLGLTTGVWVGAAGAALGLLVLQLLLVRHLQRVQRHRLAPLWLGTLLPLAVATQGMAIWFDARGRSDAMSAIQAIPWAHTATARRHLVDWGLAPADGTSPQATGKAQESALLNARAPLQCGAHEPLNVLMIVVDSLRQDMLGPEQMPHTFAFAQHAWRADRHYSTGNNTMHGLFGLFYGLPALHTNTMIRHRRGPELVRQLELHGYDFHLYGGASLQGARLDRAVFAELDAPLHTAPAHVPQDRRDRHVTEQLSSAIQTQPAGSPFFGFLLLDSAHTPYAVPTGAEKRFLPQASAGDHLKVTRGTDPTRLFNRYRNAVLKADALIGSTLAALESSGLADRTVVIITSDHGESFNDLGMNDWGHNSNFSDTQLRVPLLVRWPGRATGVQPATTSHMDLAPTLLRHLLSCTTPIEHYSVGSDLFGTLPPHRPLLVESWTTRAVRFGDDTWLLRPYGLEARDARYQIVPGATPSAEVSAALVEQMQLPQALGSAGAPP